MGRRIPRFAFLTASIKEPYQTAVWNGTVEAARANGASLICICGARLSSPFFGESPGNAAYSLVSGESVDGVIVLSTAIGAFSTKKDLREFFSSFSPLPLVSVGVTVRGFPSVCVDNESGTRGLVRHLIKDHGYTRFAFISGPAGHEEAEARLRAIKRVLAENGLPLHARNVVQGDFNASSGTRAANHFVEQGIIRRDKSAVEAVIAANDRMAIAAVETLQGKSIRVPEDVAVVGFDDIEESLSVDPPLTTVRQPLFSLGEEALQMMLGRGRRARNLSLRVEPKIRESCGCQSATPARKAEDEAARPRVGLNSPFEIEQSAVVRWTGFSFIISQEIENLFGLIAKGAQRLGLSRFWLSLFEGEGCVSEFSRLRLAVKSDSHTVYGPRGLRYRTKKLLPGGLLDRSAGLDVILLPMHFAEEHIGFLVFEHSSQAPHIHEEFRDYVGTAIKVASLVARVRDHQRELEREVLRKTLRLVESNARLRKEAGRRRKLETEVINISGEVMERVGRDLHDGLSQKLAALSMLASALEKRLSAESHADAAAAEEIVTFLNETITDSKNIARGLYPLELERNGLVPAILELVSSSRRLFNTDIGFEVKRRPENEDPARAVHLYRIVQEAIGNAVKHSRASRISVSLAARSGVTMIEIRDDGIGIPEDLSDNDGMGLRIMRYRADMLGASLAIRRLEPGTLVSVSCRISEKTATRRRAGKNTGSA